MAVSELQKAIQYKVNVTLGGAVVRYAGTNTISFVDVNWAQKSGSLLLQSLQDDLAAGAILEAETDTAVSCTGAKSSNAGSAITRAAMYRESSNIRFAAIRNAWIPNT